jgi:hypothetical protein
MLAHTAAGQKLRGQLLRKSKRLSRSIISSERNDWKMVKMKEKGKTGARALANPHEPAPQECAASDVAQNNESSSALRVKISEKNGVPQVHADIVLMEALGTTDLDFLDGILCQLLKVGNRDGSVDERGLNFLLSVIKGVKPRDQVEALLAAQMAAVHAATMKMAFRLGRTETIPQQDSAERAFNKLARTFAAQVEALKRYRSQGDQTVRVEHVTVNEGGQAIVGNVRHGGRGVPKKAEATP